MPGTEEPINVTFVPREPTVVVTTPNFVLLVLKDRQPTRMDEQEALNVT